MTSYQTNKHTESKLSETIIIHSADVYTCNIYISISLLIRSINHFMTILVHSLIHSSTLYYDTTEQIFTYSLILQQDKKTECFITMPQCFIFFSFLFFFLIWSQCRNQSTLKMEKYTIHPQL